MFKPFKAKIKLQTFGEVIKRKRIKTNLSVSQLAKKASVNALTINKIEQGGNTTMITLIKLADAMSMDLGELFENLG